MLVLIVYESMYGNTAAVARAVGDGVRAGGAEAAIAAVNEVAPEDAASADLLVVGGPTHAHGMSRAATRKTAIEDPKRAFPDPTVGDGLREWIDRLHGEGRTAATFDTRIDAPAAFTGAASKGIAKRLAGRGFRMPADRESFRVTKENHLVDGELDRATAWGRQLASSLVAA
jgi:flavodoxin